MNGSFIAYSAGDCGSAADGREGPLERTPDSRTPTLMTIPDFDDLNAHLEEIRPIIDSFCKRHSFERTSQNSLGRYPRVRIQRSFALNLWFDLWMELRKDGSRFEKFTPHVPYELSAGAFADVPDGSKYGVRHQKAILCFSGKPFREVHGVLRSEMERTLVKLESWDLDYLKSHGEKIVLLA